MRYWVPYTLTRYRKLLPQILSPYTGTTVRQFVLQWCELRLANISKRVRSRIRLHIQLRIRSRLDGFGSTLFLPSKLPSSPRKRGRYINNENLKIPLLTGLATLFIFSSEAQGIFGDSYPKKLTWIYQNDADPVQTRTVKLLPVLPYSTGTWRGVSLVVSTHSCSPSPVMIWTIFFRKL